MANMRQEFLKSRARFNSSASSSTCAAEETEEKEKKADFVIDLAFTLDELALGASKKMRISRKVTNLSGVCRSQTSYVEVVAKPGYKEGTKIRYEKYGDETPTSTQDIVFVIKEKPHEIFTREGDDLIWHYKIPLHRALLGMQLSVPSFAGRGSITVPIIGPIEPGYTRVVLKGGMPNSKIAGRVGDLKIVFEIVFPTHLHEDQKEQIERAFVGVKYPL
jgi:DnaJ family protein B protein 4